MRISRNLKGKIIVLAMLFVAILVYMHVARTFFPQKSTQVSIENRPPMKVHFIDVGQGDSTFVELPNGETMLIDASEQEFGQTVVEYINDLGYASIDYCIGTHAHADHIGGMDYVFEHLEIKQCFTTEQKNDSKDYYEFVDAVENEGISLQTACADDVIVESDNLKVEVVGPYEDEYFEDLNDSSLVILISYFDKDFLITGDAGYSEIDDYDIGDIEVLRTSHHGSYTGTSEKLLNLITPEYAVISVGENNRYGHPHESVLDMLKKHKIETYRTDVLGNIVAVCDKDTLVFQ